jgi:hypothetical protein
MIQYTVDTPEKRRLVEGEGHTSNLTVINLSLYSGCGVLGMQSPCRLHPHLQSLKPARVRKVEAILATIVYHYTMR